MKKDTFNYNLRLFYERWKWFFVNAYFIIGIALLVLLFGFVGKEKQGVDVDVENVVEKVIIEVDEPENKTTEKSMEITEEKKQQQEQESEQQEQQGQNLNSYVLINKTAMADRVSASMLVMVKGAKLVEAEKEIDNETKDYIFEKAKDEQINLFVVGGTYVISEATYTVFSDNENIILNRIHGVDMQATVLEVLDFIKDDADFTKMYVVNVVNSESCKIAFDMITQDKIPALPVDYSGVSDEVLNLISEYGVKEVEFIGEGITDSTKKKFEDSLASGNIKR